MEFMNGSIDSILINPAEGDHLLIETLEGKMRADVGDWIIKGVKGEFYPCKPDIFEATYELADWEAGTLWDLQRGPFNNLFSPRRKMERSDILSALNSFIIYQKDK